MSPGTPGLAYSALTGSRDGTTATPLASQEDSGGQKPLSGSVAILWDIENCPVPGEISAEDVACNVRLAIRGHPAIKGSVVMFSAYGDFNQFPRRLREGCQRTGVNLIDVPNGRKDASDKAILVDMFLFALDNPPPCTIFLISGDVDFAPALHKLGQRGYSVVLAVPAGLGVASTLCSAGQYVWDWPSTARGEGLLPAQAVGLRSGEDGNVNYVCNTSSPQSSDDSDNPQKADCRVFPGDRIKSVASGQEFSHFGTSSWVRPGDIDGLKGQLAKLLALNGGKLVFVRVPSEYSKLYGKPLYLSDYGAVKLAHLIERMPDAFVIKGEGKTRMLLLKERTPRKLYGNNKGKACVVGHSARHGGKSEQEDCFEGLSGHAQGEEDYEYLEDIVYGHNLDDSLSENAKHVQKMTSDAVKEPEESQQYGNDEEFVGLDTYLGEARLEVFRQELRELLVSHACRILLASFLTLYERRYSHELDLKLFGVEDLELLIAKVQDVAVVKEEPQTKMKLIVPKCKMG